MKRPTLRARILGHPVVLLPAMAATLFVLYGWTKNGEIWPLAFAYLYGMGLIMKAQERMTEYKEWQRDWDGMAPPQARRKEHPLLGLLLLVGLSLYVAAHTKDPTYATALAGMVLTVLVGGLVWWVTSARQRAATRAPKAQPKVEVCVRGLLLPVPELADAYRALPPHCHAMFDTQRQPHAR